MIIFKTLRYKNINSTGIQFTEIQLDKNKDTTLIIGTNGAGKSTILDALCFVLFGKPFRDINKPTLVNSVNGKELVVEIEFSIGKNEYKIIRGIKPNIFEIYCNREMINQDSKAKDYQEYLEKNILKMNFKAFTQIVILGSASFTPFMQMSAGDRRAVIEDLLDIQIFSVMNVIAKKKVLDGKTNITELTSDLKVLLERKKVIESNLAALQKKNDVKVQELEQQVELTQSNIEKLQKEVTHYTREMNDLIDDMADLNKLHERYHKLSNLSTKIDHNFESFSQSIEFYKSNNNCPVCKQQIDQTFKAEMIEKSANKVDELVIATQKMSQELSNVKVSIAKTTEISTKVQSIRNEISIRNSRIDAYHEEIGKLVKEMKTISSSDDLVSDWSNKLVEVTTDIELKSKELDDIYDDQAYYDQVVVMLKDAGIKARIVKKYLPVINKQVNKYLAEMNFHVNFMLDESFNETIKSRYRDDFSYNNFSEGEKARINIALLFTWRTVARLKNSVNTNLLICDEIFDSSLDNDGTEDFMKILKTSFIQESGSNVFIITHKGDQIQDKFDHVIKFEKYKGYSRIATV